MPASVSFDPTRQPSFTTVDPGFEQLRRLTEISRALTYTTSLDQVTQLTVERGAELLAAAAAVLMLPDCEGLFKVRAAHGIVEERLSRLREPMSDQLFERLQEVLEVADDHLIAVPLVVGGNVSGLLAVATRQASTSADEWLLLALADQAAVALENARLGGEVRLEFEGRLRLSESQTNAKDRALSTLAHDIRTPLGAIEGYCELLQDGLYGPVNDRQREALGRVRMSGRHLLALLDNVMEMARLNAGVVKVRAEPVRLADVAREAVHMLLPAANAKLQTVKLNTQSDAIVIADHDHLRQVLVNLIGNAVKFTPQDGSITIATSVGHDAAGEWAEVSVRDSGPGIPAAEQAAIFQPYYRSEGTALIPGVGLGLAICHALVTQMRGRLELESDPGAGSTFRILLPVK